MKGQIAHALEDAAKKVGQGLAKDFSGSYQKILKDTEQNATKVADHTAKNESGLVDGLGRTGKGEPGAGSVRDPHPEEKGPGDGHPQPPKDEPGKGDGDPGKVQDPKLNDGGDRGGQRSDGNEGTETGGTDPVDLVSGQMITSATDLDIHGLLPILLRRAYASGYRMGTLFGPGWSGTLTQRIQVDQQGIHYAGEDGQLLHYPVPSGADQQVLPAHGARWPLTWDRAADTVLIHDPETGWTRHFPAVADRGTRPLAALSERNGHRLDFRYDEAGLPVEVRHSGGKRVAVGVVRTAAGPRIEELRLLDGSNGGAGTTVVGFGYDARGRLTDVVDSSGLPLVYDWDGQDRINAWTDRTGHRYAYEYDGDGRVLRGHGPSGALSVAIAYDPANRVNTVTDSHGGRTEYHYDEHHHLARITDQLGHSVRVQHDRYNRLLRYTDPLGHSTRLTRDERGDVVRVDRPDGNTLRLDYNAFHQPVEIQTPDGLSWRQSYDERGNRTELTDRAGATTRFRYDEAGRMVELTDAHGHTSRFTSDPAGLLIEAVDPLGAHSSYQRDAFGRVVAATDPLGRTSRFGWTIEGRPLSRTLPDAGTESWTYDGEGNALTHTDAQGAVTGMEYTHFHLLSARTDPDGAHYRFTHDRLLRLVEVVNPQGQSWRYSHDAAGRVTSERDFNGRTVSYRYDEANQPVHRENGAGQQLDFHYDPLGQLVAKTDGEGRTTEYAYDAAGRLVRAGTEACELTRRYDPVGRLLAETVDGRTVTFGYDALGRRTSRRTPSGSVSGWTYDAAGNPESLTSAGHRIDFTHDALGRETGRRFGHQLVLGFGWDAVGRQTGRTASSGTAQLLHRSYAYGPGGSLTGITDQAPDGSTEHTGFELDQAGRVTAVRAADWSESYAYDSAGHLAEASWPSRRETAGQGERAYQGARLRSAGRVDYRYDAEGRVTGRRTRSLSGRTRTWRYTWDAEDRLTDVVTPDGAHWHYRYDPLGRRITKQQLIDGEDGPTVLQWTEFCWDDQTLIEQTAQGPQLPGPYTLSWEYQGLHPIAQSERLAGGGEQAEVDRRFFAIVTDLVGTPTELLSPDGTAAWRQRSTIWGVPVSAERQATDTPLRFPGQYFDPESRLHYNVHRYYDPVAARYLTADPLGLAPAPDAYGYAGNPLLACDPLGLMLRGPNGQFIANPNAVPNAHNRKSEYPSGYRVPTHNHMIQHWTDEGQAQGTHQPVDAAGVRIPEDQLTWRDANGQVVPYNQVTYEHVNPVVNHWNTTGYNTDKATRIDYYNNTANLEVMDGSTNSAGGGRMTQRYRQDTGPNYSRT